MAQKILIDTDPGIDDTIAILLALRSPELEVIGLSAVYGNAKVEFTAQNARRLVELEGHGDIPVAQGAGRPMVVPLRGLATYVHGEDGMGNTHPAAPRGGIIAKPAADFIIETILANPGEVTLVPIGPLTNIAMALRLEPKIAGLVKEVVIMGGSAYDRGNATPAAEANVSNDPHASSIVFNAGWQLTMVGLDVTHKTVMTKEYLEKLGNVGNKATDLIHRILPIYQEYHARVAGLNGNIYTHDPSAIAYLIDPSLFTTQKLPVFIETEGHCAGETVPDPQHKWINGPDTNLCVDVDSRQVLKLIEERLSR